MSQIKFFKLLGQKDAILFYVIFILALYFGNLSTICLTNNLLGSGPSVNKIPLVTDILLDFIIMMLCVSVTWYYSKSYNCCLQTAFQLWSNNAIKTYYKNNWLNMKESKSNFSKILGIHVLFNLMVSEYTYPVTSDRLVAYKYWYTTMALWQETFTCIFQF